MQAPRACRRGGEQRGAERIAAEAEQTAERWKPEATCFTTFDGKRSAYIVFDMRDSSALPAFAEPFFAELNAEVEVVPVMNGDDLQIGLADA